MAKRIQRSRKKGWRMPEGAVYVGRGSPWGNPFVVGRDGTRAECVYLYKQMLCGHFCITRKATIVEQRAAFNYAHGHFEDLRGKDLACWCGLDGKPCHADVLLELCNIKTSAMEAAELRKRDRPGQGCGPVRHG